MSHTLQSALESGQEARVVQIDLSAAFDRASHQGILYKLCSVGIGGSVLSMLTEFLSNQSQNVMVDGCRSKLVNVVSVGLYFGPVIVPPIHIGAGSNIILLPRWLLRNIFALFPEQLLNGLVS